MTRSTGHNGFIFAGSPPSLVTASRIAAKSTTAGTPVKSYKMTLAGKNGISTTYVDVLSQSNIFSMSLPNKKFEEFIKLNYLLH